MPSITLTSLTLAALPGGNQVFWAAWKPVDDSFDWVPIPNITVDPSGAIISPLPYVIDVVNKPVKVRVRNQNKCANWFEKTFTICSDVGVTAHY